MFARTARKPYSNGRHRVMITNRDANPLVQRMRDSRCSLQFGRQWSPTADQCR